MNNIAVFGAQFGDEGKARVIHHLAKDYDVVVRFSAGGNAGHTIYHKGTKIVRHLLPSADFSIPNQKAFLGSGMVINLDNLLKEVKETEALFPGAPKRIIVDPDAFTVSSKHLEEDKQNVKDFGSTSQGITPAYIDKIGRRGTKIKDLIKDNSPIISALTDLGVQFRYSYEMYDELVKSKIIFEGSQSVMLEYAHGDYPYCTSGQCSLGGIYDAGFAFAPPQKVIGVLKPYSTKVDGGVGKFLTEMPAKEAGIIQEIGFEKGATTGRLRRIGYLDLMALKYSIIKGGITSLFITKMDILNGEKSVNVCQGYNEPAFSGSDFNNREPKYQQLPGWKDAKNPLQIKPFVNFIENFTKTPVEYISAGVNPEDVIKLNVPTNIPRVDPFDGFSTFNGFDTLENA